MAASSSTSAQLPLHQHIDTALLLSVDSSAIPSSLTAASEEAREELLRSRATISTQALISALWAIPSKQHPDHGRIALLPAPLSVGSGGTPLPREKPLPAKKVETKWEAFAKRKGIDGNKKRDKLVWDDERKEWVPRWGFKGKNKDAEDQWIHELPQNVSDDHDPAKEARAERKARKLSNDAKHAKNLARATGAALSTSAAAKRAADQEKANAGLGGGPQSAAAEKAAKRKAERELRKGQLDADVKRAKVSTASMGKYDKQLKGESKEKGLRRQFAPNEQDTSSERVSQLALISGLSKGGAPVRSKPNAKGQGDADLVNARKAVRFESGGRGSSALASKGASSRGGRGGKASRGGKRSK
ncbi:RRS1-domain-containing protein [Ceraceosorus guamensis]|uniref:Ribosome biogenesis regulatory protein n=1 Tax=Ceraceosorus guamensis TaxID=1522189 RepID=A0A316W6R2_9BASI|nr:RRS1-domain-containing protein [Ceraceosorus guamensis]PWN43763.1 RRS1-domain-containing protein [Ceraceosorus guamensis]